MVAGFALDQQSAATPIPTKDALVNVRNEQEVQAEGGEFYS
jgi:hypothetical protein